MLMLFVLQDEGVGLQDAHLLNLTLLLVQHRTDDDCNLLVEVVILVVNPLLYDATCQFLVVIVKHHQLACLLIHSQVKVCQLFCLLVGREFFSHFTDGTLDLLQGLFCCFHVVICF